MSLNLIVAQDNKTNNETEVNETLKIDIDELTNRRLSEIYSQEELSEVMKDGNKLFFLNYYYSSSFIIKEGQTYDNDSYLKIDISSYRDLFSDDSNVEIQDENSGITIILKSLNEISEETDNKTWFLNPKSTVKRINN